MRHGADHFVAQLYLPPSKIAASHPKSAEQQIRLACRDIFRESNLKIRSAIEFHGRLLRIVVNVVALA